MVPSQPSACSSGPSVEAGHLTSLSVPCESGPAADDAQHTRVCAHERLPQPHSEPRRFAPSLLRTVSVAQPSRSWGPGQPIPHAHCLDILAFASADLSLSLCHVLLGLFSVVALQTLAVRETRDLVWTGTWSPLLLFHVGPPCPPQHPVECFAWENTQATRHGRRRIAQH